MFFEGCPPHLGCSVKLRGASEYELARVKEIIKLMVCVAYHSQLEISFLMDEFAMPPSLPQSSSFPCLLGGGAAEEEMDGDSQESTVLSEDSAAEGHPENKASPSESEQMGILQDIRSQDAAAPPVHEGAPSAEAKTSSPVSSPPALPPFLMEEEQEMDSDTLIGVTGEEDSRLREGSPGLAETPKLFRDPLQDDTGMFVAEQVSSSDDQLKSISAAFKQELKDIILCISPFITFREPFLLTAEGMHCPSRDYFPEQVPLCGSDRPPSRERLHLLMCFRLLGVPLSSPQQGPERAGRAPKTADAQGLGALQPGGGTDGCQRAPKTHRGPALPQSHPDPHRGASGQQQGSGQDAGRLQSQRRPDPAEGSRRSLWLCRSQSRRRLPGKTARESRRRGGQAEQAK